MPFTPSACTGSFWITGWSRNESLKKPNISRADCSFCVHEREKARWEGGRISLSSSCMIFFPNEQSNPPHPQCMHLERGSILFSQTTRRKGSTPALVAIIQIGAWDDCSLTLKKHQEEFFACLPMSHLKHRYERTKYLACLEGSDIYTLQASPHPRTYNHRVACFSKPKRIKTKEKRTPHS